MPRHMPTTAGACPFYDSTIGTSDRPFIPPFLAWTVCLEPSVNEPCVCLHALNGWL